MKLVLPVLLLLICFHTVFGQKDEEFQFLIKNKSVIDLQKPEFSFSEDFFSNQLFFFGFVHGSETPQLLDFELLKRLHESGVQYYAPEVDFSLAYFFNTYIHSGDEKVLDYACANYTRVRQDASIQFKEKWRKIYAYNSTLKEENKINILGFDYSLSQELSLTHLAYLAPEEHTSIPLIDSLRHFKYLELNSTSIISGKPVYKSGKSWDYFFGTNKSRYFQKFQTAYMQDSLKIQKAFGDNVAVVQHLMRQTKSLPREKTIFKNFTTLGIPLINAGEKIYANYGFTHVLQDKINGYAYWAKMTKESSHIKQVTILGLLSQSECLNKTKIKGTGQITIKEVKFRGAKYNGYKTSRTLDADSFFEQVKGRKMLLKASKSNDVSLFKLEGTDSPFNTSMFFINMKRGGRKWKVDPNLSTTDYAQYILFIKNSSANIPLQEEEEEEESK